jgi:hypothetical protein
MRRGRRRACNRCNIQSEHTMLQRWVSDQKPIAATHNQKPRSRRGSVLRATCVAMVQGPACVKERERKLKKIATIQNQCRWLRGVESLELQQVAGTIGPARMREIAVTRTRE